MKLHLSDRQPIHSNLLNSGIKKLFLLTGSLFVLNTPSNAQINSSTPWVWMHGDNAGQVNGVYGTLGTAAPANKPGSRTQSISWSSKDGQLWLFGGYGNAATASGRLNDLWKYDLASNQWVWVHGNSTVSQLGVYGTRGVASPLNKPGARSSSARWTDTSGNLWLFGGFGFGTSGGANRMLNDLWKFEPAAGTWTWISGDTATSALNGIYGQKGVAAATNNPGSRHGAVSWQDKAGNFWLFGGTGHAASGGQGFLNDLWMYQPSSGQWTWVSGDSVLNQGSIYGVTGVAAPGNKPGCRAFASGWLDTAGHLWFFGGDYSGTLFNDLWRFNPQTQEWTWMKGDNVPGQNGVYGTKDVANAANKPGSRYGAASWSDNYNNFYLFGGIGFAASGGSGFTNDFWKYDASTGDWTWINGASVANAFADYGTLGQEAPGNIPGSRNMSAYWVDHQGKFWMMAGDGYPDGGRATVLNDLWKLNHCVTPLPPTAIEGAAIVCAESDVVYTVSPVEWASSYTWILPPGWTGSSTGTEITAAAGNTGGVIQVAAHSACATSDTFTFDVTVNDPEAVITTDRFTLGTTLSFATYQWMKDGQLLAGQTNEKYTVTANGDYQVAVTDDEGCTDTSAIYTVNNYTSINTPGFRAQWVNLYPNPVQETLLISAPFETKVAIYSLEGRLLKEAHKVSRLSLHDLAPGIYLVHVTDAEGNQIKTEKLVKL